MPREETLTTSRQRHWRLRRHALPGGDVEIPRRETAPLSSGGCFGVVLFACSFLSFLCAKK
jgi:hypothetical protein